MPPEPRDGGHDTLALALVAERFKVLAEPARLRVLDALRHGSRHVRGLVDATGLQQANPSRQLQQLYVHGFLVRSRQGTFVSCAIADPQVFALCDLMYGQLERSQRLRRARTPARRRPSGRGGCLGAAARSSTTDRPRQPAAAACAGRPGRAASRGILKGVTPAGDLSPRRGQISPACAA